MLRYNEASRVTILKPWSEAVGLLLDINDTTLVFDDFVLLINPNVFESIYHVKSLIGEVVSILRTDIPGKEYLVRVHTNHSR